MTKSYPEGFDRSLQLAGTALTFMKKNGIPTNPNNFLVWYEFFSGSNAALKEALQPLLQSGELSGNATEEIYTRFFAEDTDAGEVREIGDQMHSVIRDVSSLLSTAHGDTQSYGQALDGFSGDLAIAGDVSDIKDMIGRIIGETQGMAERVKELQEEVAASGQKVSQLSSELEKTKKDAMSDGLTGIANRKCFDITLANQMAQTVEDGGTLSLILADLDHFKGFNDTYGHPVGDQVLRVVGRTLKELTKGQDLAARYGGEEFAIILPNTDLQGAAAVAENLRAAVASKKLRRRGSDTPLDPLTVSLGVTIYHPGEPASAFIDRADRALYAAKRGGRNKVVVGEDPADVRRAVG